MTKGRQVSQAPLGRQIVAVGVSPRFANHTAPLVSTLRVETAPLPLCGLAWMMTPHGQRILIGV